MSDALLQSAFIYQEISKYEYYFIFGDKKRNLYYIPIKLKNENYPHLIGIDKLTDKKELIFKKGKDKIEAHIIRYKSVIEICLIQNLALSMIIIIDMSHRII